MIPGEMLPNAKYSDGHLVSQVLDGALKSKFHRTQSLRGGPARLLQVLQVVHSMPEVFWTNAILIIVPSPNDNSNLPPVFTLPH